MSRAIAVPAVRSLRFAAGLSGFPEAHEFELDALRDAEAPFLVLRHIGEPSLEFVVVAPDEVFPDYAAVIDADAAERLGLTSVDHAAVLAIVSWHEQARRATVNLLGPIVVNRHTGEATQVVMTGSGHTTREALPGGFPSPSTRSDR